MNKKLIALAVAGAFAAPVAMADSGNVTLYGQARVSYDSVDPGNTATFQGQKTTRVSSNASRVGLKGTEDLGGGLSAVWQIETTVDFDGTGSGTLGTRNTFAGLSGTDWGTLTLGRNDTPYKVATRRMDIFADTLGDNRSLMGMGYVGFDARPSNIINYTSPSMSGFTVAAAYVAGAETATTSGQTKGQTWGLSGTYDAAPLYATLAYQVNDLGNGAGAATLGALGTAGASANEKAWKLGVGYKMDAFEGNIAYEKTSDDLGGKGVVLATTAPATVACTTVGADCLGHKNWYLSGKYSFGNDAVKLAYTKAGDLNLAGAGTSTGAKQVTIGYDHSFSKRTTFYALYTKLSNDLNVGYALSSTTVATGSQAAGGRDADPAAWSFGLNHSF